MDNLAIKNLLDELDSLGIYIYLQDGRLKLRTKLSAVPSEHLTRIKANKTALIAYMQQHDQKQGPLSSAQKRIWFISEYEENSAAYNMSGLIEFSQPLEEATLEQALNRLLAKHQILRSNFAMGENGPVQKVNDSHYLSLSTLETKGLDCKESIAHLLRDELTYSFDLSEELLLRAVLITGERQEKGRWFYVAMHHIIADGWSVGLFVQALLDELAELSLDDEGALQYLDYVHWERQYRQSDEYQAQLHYWQTSLLGMSLFELPTCYPRASNKTYHGSHVHFVLDQEILTHVDTVCAHLGATRFVVLIASFYGLLYRYSQQSDITIGVPVLNRDQSEFDSMIGCFINTLPLRLKLPSEQSFTQLVALTQNLVKQSLANQNVAIEDIISKLNLPKSSAHSALFQVLFNYNGVALDTLSADGLSARLHPLDNDTAKFDLTLTINESAQGLECVFDYSASLFDDVLIERMGQDYEALVKALCSDTELNLSELVLPSHQINPIRSHKHALLTPLPELIASTAESKPSQIALIDGDKSLSYTQLIAQSSALASNINQQDAFANERFVAILVDGHSESIVAMLGVMFSGRAYLPIDINTPTERIIELLKQATCKNVVVLNEFALKQGIRVGLDEVDVIVHSLTELVADQRAHASPEVKLNSDDCAYVIFTSGTTGKPKGVMLSHNALSHYVASISQVLSFDENTRSAVVTGLATDLCLTGIYPVLASGGTVILNQTESGHLEPNDMIAQLARTQTNFIKITPSFASELLPFLRTADHLPPIKQWVLGGEPLTEQTVAQIRALYPNAVLVNHYGPTESCIGVTCNVLSSDSTTNWGSFSIGKPLAHVQTLVLDASQRPVTQGMPGELYIGGASLALGYINEVKMSEDAFITLSGDNDEPVRFYRTGDKVRVNACGELEYLGRLDNQPKIRGFRVDILDVEAKLKSLAIVSNAAVTCKFIAEQAVLVGHVVAYETNRTDTQLMHDIKIALKALLPEPMIPSVLVLCEQLPMLTNGKIDRKELAQRTVQITQSVYVAPTTPLQTQLVEIFTQLTECVNVGIHDDFFAIGGHSLLAMKLINCIRDELGYPMSLKAVFANPTVADIAQYLEAQPMDFVSDSVYAMSSYDGQFPLSFSQQRLWFVDQMQGHSRQYNLQGVFTLSGVVDLQALERSFADVIDAHKVLAFNFFTDANGELIQRYNPQWQFHLKTQSLSGMPETLQAQAIDEIIDQDYQLSFDLSKDLLIRAQLIELGDLNHLLMVTMHHIASDGWSIALCCQALSQAYQTRLLNEHGQISTPSHSYLDFALWQREQEQKGGWQRDLDYWQEKLAQLPKVHELPTDFERGNTKLQGGGLLVRHLPSTLSSLVKQYVGQSGNSLFLVLHTVFNLWLSRASGQSFSIIGTPVSGRERKEFEAIIGNFINTLVLKNEFTDEATFEQVLASCKVTLSDAIAHQQIPFDLLVDELSGERSIAIHPLMQIVFRVNNQVNETLKLQGLAVDNYEVTTRHAKLDLEVSIIDEGDRLKTEWLFDSALWLDASIERFFEQYCYVLEQCLKTPLKSFKEIQLCPINERKRLLEFAQTLDIELSHSKRWEQKFSQIAALYPQKVAVQCNDTKISYSRIEESANRLAHCFMEMEFEPQSRIGILLPSCPEMVTVMLAILKANHVYVPLHMDTPVNGLAAIVEDAQMSMILAFSADSEKLIDSGTDFLLLDDLFDEESNFSGYPTCAVQHDVPIDSTQLCYIIYTSGSTGRPKGVAISHDNLNTYLAHAIDQYFQETPLLSTSVVSTPLAFDATVTSLIPPLVKGLTVNIVPAGAQQMSTLHSLMMNSTQPMLFKITPAHLRIINLLSTAKPCMNAHTLVIGGQALTSELVVQLRKHLPNGRIINEYGPTETTVGSSVHVVEPSQPIEVINRYTDIPIGLPIHGATMMVVDKFGKPAPINSVGELLIGGSVVSSGYLNRDDLNERAFIDVTLHDSGTQQRFYRTGDMVKWVEVSQTGNLYLRYCGRKDEQLKLRGYRVNVGAICHHANSFPAIKDSAVTYNKEQETLCLHFCCDKANSVDITHLKAFLATCLPPYMIPSRFDQVSEIPINRNGKVDLKALQDHLVAEDKLASERVDLSTLSPLQAYLLQAFTKLLKREDITLTDGFFELGGHSLLAIRLINQIRQDKHYDITLEQLFKTPSVNTLAIALESCAPIMSENRIAPVSRAQRLPLSYAQQRVWLIDQLQQGSVQYHMPATFEITGRLDIKAVSKALEQIIERHEVLRTIIIPGSKGEEPEQVINDKFQVPLLVSELPETNIYDQQTKLQALLSACESAPFDLTCDVLLRVNLFCLSPTRYYLHFNMHHIASDGWSMSLLTKEFVAFYRHFSGEVNYTLSLEQAHPLGVQYADFAYWQRSGAHKAKVGASLSYWQQQLVDCPSLHQLPLDFPRPKVQSLSGQSYTCFIPNNLVTLINEQCRAHDVTLFMWLQSVFALFVMRYSGATDVLIGSPVAGREQSEVKDLIGFFVNTIVIRSSTKTNTRFNEFLLQQKQIIIDAFTHQSAPFEKVVELIQPERELSHQPLFQILFALQNNEQTEFTLPDLDISLIQPTHHNMKFDLELNAMECERGIELRWNYSTSLFKERTVIAMSEAFYTLVSQLAENANLVIEQVPLLSQRQAHELLNVHQLQKPYDKTPIHARFDAVVQQNPEQIAISDAYGIELTYQQLQRKSAQLASYLVTQNVKPGDYVAICIPPSCDSIIAMLAVLQLGAAYIPIDSKLPKSRCAYIIQDSDARILITTQALLVDVPDICVLAIDDTTQWENTPLLTSWPVVHPDQQAYVIYTSGTTGQPKGVAITHANLALYLDHAITHYLPEHIARSVVSTPLAFDATVTAIWAPLLKGLCVEMLSDGDELLEILAIKLFDSRPSLFKLTPAHLQGMIDYAPKESGEALHQVVVGGEAFNMQLLNKLVEKLPNCDWYNEYGPTETTVGTSLFHCDAHKLTKLNQTRKTSVPIGTPIANTQLLVLDENQQLAPIGVVGELYIGGENLSSGYLNKSTLTEEKFVMLPFGEHGQLKRFYRSGDKVSWVADNNQAPAYLQFFGRVDHQIKLRGYRIELADIESQLHKLAQIEQAFVALDEKGDNLEAFLLPSAQLLSSVLNENSELPSILSKELAATLMSELLHVLPSYMLPSRFIVLDEMPVTSNGKKDHRKLKAISAQCLTPTQNISPRNEFEQSLQSIFISILDVPSVGITDDFFALGGHSLLATQCVALIKEQLDIDMPTRVLFERPTIMALSQWYAISQAVNEANPKDSETDNSEEMFL